LSYVLLTLSILLFALYLGFRLLINSKANEPGSVISKIGGILLISLTGVIFVSTIIFGAIRLVQEPIHEKELYMPHMKQMVHYGPPGSEFEEKQMFCKKDPRILEFKKEFKEKLEDPEKQKEFLKERIEKLQMKLEELETEEKSPTPE